MDAISRNESMIQNFTVLPQYEYNAKGDFGKQGNITIMTQSQILHPQKMRMAHY